MILCLSKYVLSQKFHLQWVFCSTQHFFIWKWIRTPWEIYHGIDPLIQYSLCHELSHHHSRNGRDFDLHDRSISMREKIGMHAGMSAKLARLCAPSVKDCVPMTGAERIAPARSLIFLGWHRPDYWDLSLGLLRKTSGRVLHASCNWFLYFAARARASRDRCGSVSAVVSTFDAGDETENVPVCSWIYLLIFAEFLYEDERTYEKSREVFNFIRSLKCWS